MFNFYEYFKNIDAFAVVDIIIFVLVLALLTVFYVRKKQLNVLLIFLALVAVGLALNIVSYVFGGTVLTAARIIMLFLIFSRKRWLKKPTNINITKNTMKYDATNVPTVDSDKSNQPCNSLSSIGDINLAANAAITHDNVATVSNIPPRILAQTVDATITPM